MGTCPCRGMYLGRLGVGVCLLIVGSFLGMGLKWFSLSSLEGWVYMTLPLGYSISGTGSCGA